MSDIAQTLIKCYEALRDPNDPNFQGAQETLKSIYQNPSSFSELIQFVTMDGVEEIYRQYAIVGVGSLFKKYYRISSPEDQKIIFDSLLPLLVFPNSQYVRTYVLPDVRSSFRPDYIQTAIEFINQQQANLNDIGIEASLNILSMILSYQEYTNDLASISLPLIEKGLNSHDNNVRAAAIQYGLYYANLIQTEEGFQLLTQYIEYALQVIIDIARSNDNSRFKLLQDFVKAFTVLLDQQNEDNEEDQGFQINPNPILSTCLEIISNQDIAFPFRSQVQILSDILIFNYVDTFSKNQEIVRSILQVYFQYAQSLFNPRESSIDLTEHNIFSTIGVEFANYPEILEFVWSNIIISISSTHEGLFASIVFLIYSLYGGRDYFQSKISDLTQLFIQGLNEEFICTNEAAARAIGELASSQKKHIKSVSDPLIRALLTKLQTIQNVEFMESLGSIAKYADDVGPIFADILNALTALLQVNNITFQSSVLECLSNLVFRSPKQARHFFQQIAGLCFQILSSGDSLDDFKQKATKTLSFLMESSTKLFTQYASDFHQYVVQNLQSDDLQILKESIRAYGHLLQNYSNLVESSIASVFPKLKELASKDISIGQEDEDEIFSGQTDPECKDLDVIADLQIDVVTAAIRVLTKALEIYPQLIADNLGSIIEIIKNQVNVGNSDCEFGCAEGCCILLECVLKEGINEKTRPVIVELVSLLTQISNSEGGADTAGVAFTGISDVIASDETLGILCCYDNLELILDSIKKVFNGENLYQSGKPTYIEELHEPAMRVVREIIAAMKGESIKAIGHLVPIFNKFVDDKSFEMRDLILQFYGDLVYWATDAVDDELKRNTFILAYNAIEKRNSAIGFGVIKQLATKAPQIITGQIAELLGFIKKQLEIKEVPPTEALQSIQDNAESALAMIAMNILKEQFPIADFLQVALSRMPAQIDAEETNDHIQFFFWLYEVAGNCGIQKDNLPSFVAVPIRLFSDPMDKLEEYCVSKDNVQRMLKILKEFSTFIDNEGFKNFVYEVCENDEFKIESVFEALES